MLTLIWFFLGWMGCTGPVSSLENEGSSDESALPPILTDASIEFRPSIDAVPANGLTLRIYFPESIRLSGQQIRITDLEGRDIDGAMSQWVWDEERFVLRLEPKGLQPGSRFAVVIEGLVTEGGRVIPSFSRLFKVREEDATPPDGSLIVLRGELVVGSSAPLELVFNEPIRWTSLMGLSVLAGANAVAGQWALGPHQTRATFRPTGPWGDKQVYLTVGAGVSDLAGNQMVNLPTGMLTPPQTRKSP